MGAARIASRAATREARKDALRRLRLHNRARAELAYRSLAHQAWLRAWARLWLWVGERVVRDATKLEAMKNGR